MALKEYDLIVDSREKENTLRALDSYGIKYTIKTLSLQSITAPQLKHNK